MSAQSYIAIKHTEKFESLLPRCQIIQYNKKAYALSGFIGKMMRMGQISALLAMPKIFIKKGSANREDIENFPKKYKKLLTMLLLSNALLIFAFTSLWLIGKLTYPS